MGNFGDKFRNFMMGRYGMDEFGRFLNVGTLILLVASMIMTPFLRVASYVVWGVTLVIIGYIYFRVFSRNHSARMKENQWFLRVRSKLTRGRFSPYSQYGSNYGYGGGYSNTSQNMSNEQKKKLDRRTHKIFKCPNCAQKIRVPKRRGKICIKCPKCRIEFIRKT